MKILDDAKSLVVLIPVSCMGLAFFCYIWCCKNKHKIREPRASAVVKSIEFIGNNGDNLGETTTSTPSTTSRVTFAGLESPEIKEDQSCSECKGSEFLNSTLSLSSSQKDRDSFSQGSQHSV